MTELLKTTLDEVTALPARDQDILLQMVRDYLAYNQSLKDIVNRPTDYYQRVAEVSFFTNKILGPYTKALFIEGDNGLYLTDPQDYEVGWHLRKEGCFEPEQIEFLKTLVQPENRLLIVGAHIGTIAIPMANHCKYVAAIEANPHTYRLLRTNIALNQLDNCDSFNVAANDHAESLPFLLNRSNSGGSKRKPKVDQFLYHYDNPEEVSIPGLPLDELFINQTFDTILMDIEGSEYFALKGMPRLLQSASTLILEFLPHHLKNISGVSVSEFLDVLPAYDTLEIPSLHTTVEPQGFAEILTHMYDNDLGDNAIVFKRARQA